MCAGDLPPFDHPHVYIDMGDDNEILCPYCATLFTYDPALAGLCEPADCIFDPDIGEPPPPASDISIVTADASDSAAASQLEQASRLPAAREKTDEA